MDVFSKRKQTVYGHISLVTVFFPFSGFLFRFMYEFRISVMGPSKCINSIIRKNTGNVVYSNGELVCRDVCHLNRIGQRNI